MDRLSLRSLVGLTGLLGLLLSILTPPVGAENPALVMVSKEFANRVVTPTERIATVGDQTIFAADVLPSIDQLLAKAAGEIPPDQVNLQRAMYVQQLLPRKIEAKLVLVDFYRSIPADKLKEVLANIDKQVGKQFYSEHVPLLQKQFDVEFLRDLDSKLRSFGTSIAAQKGEFREQMITRTMIGQNIDRSPEITRDELLSYYRDHIDDYEVHARAKWEKLTAGYDKFPSKAAADLAIVEMGNQVLRGADFATVAKKHSQGVNAWQGGLHDWTTKGSLLSEKIDHAIFTLAPGQLSRKIEDEQGFHIVRVLERQAAGQVTFPEAQEEIREQLQEELRQKQVKDYLKGLREKTHVWTIFDDVPKQDS